MCSVIMFYYFWLEKVSMVPIPIISLFVTQIRWVLVGLTKGGLSVGRRPKILRNVLRRLGNETRQCQAGVECHVSGHQFLVSLRATLILGWMSVSDGKNDPVSGVDNTPFMGLTSKPGAFTLPVMTYLTVSMVTVPCTKCIKRLCKQQYSLHTSGASELGPSRRGAFYGLYLFFFSILFSPRKVST